MKATWIFLLLGLCLPLIATETIEVPVTEGKAVPDSFWSGRKKANAHLCFVEDRNDVSATLIAEGSPTHPKIWASLLASPTQILTWAIIWEDVCMSPDLLGHTWTSASYPPNITWATTPTPAGDVKMLGANGVVKAGQFVGFQAWGDGAKVYTTSEYNYDQNVGWLYFGIPEMPDHCLACLEERPIVLQSDRDFNDVVLLINMGAANVQATLENQGFSPTVKADSQLGKVLATYLPKVTKAMPPPVEPEPVVPTLPEPVDLEPVTPVEPEPVTPVEPDNPDDGDDADNDKKKKKCPKKSPPKKKCPKKDPAKADLLVTMVEIRGTVKANRKVVTCVNGNVVSKSQRNWKYRFPVKAGEKYVLLVETKDRQTEEVLDDEIVTVFIGEEYGVAMKPVQKKDKGNGIKPPAPDDF